MKSLPHATFLNQQICRTTISLHTQYLNLVRTFKLRRKMSEYNLFSNTLSQVKESILEAIVYGELCLKAGVTSGRYTYNTSLILLHGRLCGPQGPLFTLHNRSNALPPSNAQPPVTSNLYFDFLTSTLKNPSLCHVLPIALNK